MGLGSLLLLVSGLAVVVAVDAYRSTDKPRLAISLVVAVLAGGCGVAVFDGAPLPVQNRLQREFGSDWDCSSGAVCVRRPAPH